MKNIKQAAFTYFLGLWCSIILIYIVNGHFQMLFSGSTFVWFMVATVFLFVIVFLLYVITTQLLNKCSGILPLFWMIIPLCAIAVYMQLAFEAIVGNLHGFGYVRGVGDAKKTWLMISAIWSFISWWFFIRRKTQNMNGE
jgi:hypothetical protein